MYTVVNPRTLSEKRSLLVSRAIEGALNPEIRKLAVDLVRGADNYDHAERLRRLHAFVRDNVDYHREPVEMFQHPVQTLYEGGDCDDHVALLSALAWSIKYPFSVEPYPNWQDHAHYTTKLGYPESETWQGDEDTTWVDCETTIQAKFGEHVSVAERRSR